MNSCELKKKDNMPKYRIINGDADDVEYWVNRLAAQGYIVSHIAACNPLQVVVLLARTGKSPPPAAENESGGRVTKPGE
ncbi:MAG: hypothetical protein HY320_05275 [Armatimonadetes bacterium]|nr:hypothetical protein [Armatimonadota bacterium]